MRNLIIGIIAVICLDIGFIAYTSIDSTTIATATLEIGSTPDPLNSSVATTLTAVPEFTTSGSTDIVVVKKASSAFEQSKARRSAYRTPETQAKLLTNTKDRFPPVTIIVPTTVGYSFKTTS